MKKIDKKFTKVSGGQKDTFNTVDLVNRTRTVVDSKVGAEINANISNFKTSGNINLINNDQKTTTSKIDYTIIDKTKKITGGIG